MDAAFPCAGLEPAAKRAVTRILDGETVALDDGSELRLAGALAPRAIDVGADPGTWPIEVAARAELGALLLGRSIDVAFGDGERIDRYGRLQAQVFWRDGDKIYWAQGHMLEQGLARAYTLAGTTTCQDELLAAERTAREARRELWREAAYQVRQADRSLELARLGATFQVVEGRVARVSEVRGVVYLNFDADWRKGFSASLRRADRSLLGGFADRPKALSGQSVRVRGWIELKPGPMIDLSSAGLIEFIGPAGIVGTGPTQYTRRRPAGSNRHRQGPDPQTPPAAQTKPPDLVETGR